jgi:YD repeat-containing protein
MLTAILILLMLNVILTFLALSATGRVIGQMWDDAGASVEAHNTLVRKFQELSDTNNSALDCLVSVDAALDIIRRDHRNKTA